ncbi:MAG: PhoH family protein, partial [Tidjanibacter sp.]|nr:PhoH family protein [Tidjanibacter sp.]
VHGNDGKPIKARNRTQQDMVKSYFENDLIFAVGPAGTGKTPSKTMFLTVTNLLSAAAKEILFMNL